MISCILTYKGKPRGLHRCMESLHAQTRPLDEIILIDGNREGESESDSIRIGIDRSRGNILFFTNVDCTVPEDWVERHLAWHARGYDIVSGNRLNVNPLSSSWNALHYGKPQYWQGPGLGWTGANGSVKRGVIERTSFNPSEPRGWDVWLSIASVKAGFRMVIDPILEVKHDHEFRSAVASFLYARWTTAQATRISRAIGKDGLDPTLRSTLAEILPVNAVKVWRKGDAREPLLRFVFHRALFRFGQFLGYLSFPLGFDVWDYARNQIKFSAANLLSVPVGTFLLWFFTSEMGVWYVWSSLLSLIVTTTMNFWMNHFLKTRLELKKK